MTKKKIASGIKGLSIEERGLNTYRLRYELGIDPITGKRRRKSKTVQAKNKTQLGEEIKAFISEMEKGLDVSNLKVDQYLLTWLDDRDISEATYTHYKLYITNHINPQIGHLYVKDVTPMILMDFKKHLLEKKKNTGKGKLAPGYVGHIISLLKRALETAVLMRIIDYNPASAVQAPSGDAEMVALSRDQVKHFVQVAKRVAEYRYYALIYFGFTTGMRRNELLGLRWIDVDQDEGYFRVNGALNNTRKANLGLGSTKTRSSQRIIYFLDNDTIPILKELKKEQKKNKLLFGADYKDQDFVFCDPNGSPILPRTFNYQFYKVRDASGLQLRLHDMRHTHITRLIEEGVPVKVIQERSGHADISVLLNRYAHVLKGVQKEALKNVRIL